MRFFNVLLIVLGALVLWVDAQATLDTAHPATQSPPAISTSLNPNQPTLPNSQTIVASPDATSSSVGPSPVAPSSITSSPVTPPSDTLGPSPVTTQAPANTNTPLTVAPGVTDSTSIADSPTPTTDQPLATGSTDSSSLSASDTQSSDDGSLSTSTTFVTIPKSSTTASSSITPSPCLSTGQKLTLSSCADTTNYYCNTTTSMCVPKQADNASCTDNLMCHVNSACQNLVCVPLASNSNSGGGGVNVGKVGIIAGVIAGIFVLAGIAFWAYGFLSERKENRRRMDEPYESKNNSKFEPSTDYPFISRPNSFSNSDVPPPAVIRPDMRVFGGATNNNSYGRPPPPTTQYNQQRNNYTEFGNTNADRSSKYNYLSTAFTKMRFSMGYGINNPQTASANSSLPFTTTNESRTDANPQAQLTNDFNVATHDVKYPLGNVEEEDLEENGTLRDSNVLPVDDQDVFSLISESPYLGLERNSNSSTSQDGDRRRYKMGSMYSHYTESWGSNHMLDAATMPTSPTTTERKNWRDKKNDSSARTTLALPSDDQVPRQSVIQLNAPIFNNGSTRHNMGRQHLQQPSVSSVASSGYSLNYYNASKANERTLAPMNVQGRLVYSSTFGDESEHGSNSGDENLTIEEKLSRQEYTQQRFDEDISELERDIESVRSFADRAWNN